MKENDRIVLPVSLLKMSTVIDLPIAIVQIFIGTY